MTQSQARLKFLVTTTMAAGLGLLSACGGGGGGGSTPTTDPELVPQSVSGSYAVMETRSRQNASSSVAAKVQVVDLRTGAVARSYELGGTISNSYPNRGWHVIEQYKPDLEGLGINQDGASQLAVIQNGRVMLLDLTGNTLGAARQLSSLSNACKILKDDVYLGADGRHVWLQVETGGDDNDCLNTADNHRVLVSTDMSNLSTPQDAGVAYGPVTGGKDIILALRDRGNVPQGVLVLDRTTRSLAVYTNDLGTKLYDVPATGHTITADDAARGLAHSPVSAKQTLMQLGTAVYIADWNGARLTLGEPVGALTQNTNANTETPVVVRDAENYYVADGSTGLAISATRAQHHPCHFSGHWRQHRGGMGDQQWRGGEPDPQRRIHLGWQRLLIRQR